MPYQKQPKVKNKPVTKTVQRKALVARRNTAGATLNRENVLEAIRQNNGIISYAAEQLGCNRSTITNWIKNDPEIAQVHKDARESLIDQVESTYIQKAIDGDSYNGTFLLRTLGRERGYEYDHKEANLALVQISRYIMNKTQTLVVDDKSKQLVQDE